MRIQTIEAIPVRLPRQRDKAVGTAGTPTVLSDGAGDYRWSSTVTALYSNHFETALIKITTDSGAVGWGEAQAPLAPEVACDIVRLLLRPVIENQDFRGEIDEIRDLWWRMYSAMRVRGQNGGFMLDAISGVDIALWDLAGKIQGQPVSRMIAGEAARIRVPAYLSGLAGSTASERIARAQEGYRAGFRLFKLFYDSSASEFMNLLKELRAELHEDAGIAVDGMWRLTDETVVAFCHGCDEIGAVWLEAPLMPEDPDAHAKLARAIRTPLALGESYRTLFELRPFLENRSIRYVQPDLGRCGITETLRIAGAAASRGCQIVPHLSVALGPQIAAAIQVAAALECCPVLEFNPGVFEVANRFLVQPLNVDSASYETPAQPGLGIEIAECYLRNELFSLRKNVTGGIFERA